MALTPTKPLGVMIGGPRGPRGLVGPMGPGVPAGGVPGQTLVKQSNADGDTAWTTATLSVAGKTGTVTLDKLDVGLANVDNTSDANKPVSGPQQAALDAKAPLASPTFTGTVGGITKAMVGLGNVDNTADSAKPVSLAQQAALDLKANLASPTFTGTVSGVTKAMVGLANVDNTSDLDKPVSTAVQSALNLRAPLASPTFTGTVSGITKAMVGLGNVDNTADADKPLSNAAITALGAKAPIANPTFTGTVGGVTKAMVGLSNVDNTADADKPVSAPQLAALAQKAPLANPSFTGTVSGITKSMVGLGNVDNTSDANKPISTAQQAALDAKATKLNPVFTFDAFAPATGLDKTRVGLGNVDNTSDAAKPISTATQAALDALDADIAAKPDAATIAATYAPKANPTFTGTVSGITKSMVGLGSVDNTSDAAKPVSLAQQAALDAKAPLASPTFTGTVGGITKSMVGLGNVDNTSDANKPVSSAQAAAIALRAPINSPTFTGTVSGITKAMVGLSNVDNTSDLAKPISTAMQAALDGKISGHNPTFTFDAFAPATGLDKTRVGLDNVDNTSDMAKPVSTLQQAAIDARAPKANPTFTGTVSGITKAMVGLGSVDNTSDANKPVSTAQAAALALKANLASPTFTGTVGGITKAMVGLGNVDNTSDANKPLSVAMQVALDAKAPVNSPTFTGTVSGVTKAHVGLSNVDNTSDAAKPISTATQAALNAKASSNSPTFTGTVSGITKAMVGLANVDNTSDAAKPISTATQAALDAKAPVNNPAFTGTVSGITKTHVGLGNVDNTSDAAKPLSTAMVAALAGKVSTAVVGSANGVAGLGSDGKVPMAQLPSGIGGGLTYAGTWNASTNTPNLSLLSPANGTYYKVSAAGNTIISGNGGWAVGDLVVYNQANNAWEKLSGGNSDVLSVNGLTGAVTLTKVHVGLNNVDNTSDVAKPVSTAQQNALNLKANLASPTFTGTVGGITKSMVGLGSVDNTSDLAKPISTATQTALNQKAPINNPTFTGTVSGITKAMVGLANVDNTSDLAKPISTAVQAALDLKANVGEGGGGVTKESIGLGNVDNTSDADKPVSTAQSTAIGLRVAKTGDNMSGPLNLARSTVASAAAPNIWGGANQIDFTGSSTVTGFAAAPQAGAERTLIISGTPTFQAGANMLIEGLSSGQSYVAQTFDIVTVRAISPTQFRLSVNKYNGMAMVGAAGNIDPDNFQSVVDQTLTDGSTVNWNAALGSTAYLTLGNISGRTIANPTNLKKGAYTLIVIQDSNGGRTISTWGSNFTLIGDTSLASGGGQRTVFYFVSNGVTLTGGVVFRSGTSAPAPSPEPAPSPSPSPSPSPAPAPAWSPAEIFPSGGGILGAWFDPEFESLDTTATSGVNIQQVGDRVGKWIDKSGNGYHVVQTNDATRPTFLNAAGNLPCVDYFDMHGLRNATAGGGATTSCYGCIGIEMPTASGTLWADVATGTNTGIRIVYSSGDGGVSLVAGNGTTTVSLFEAMPNPPGKMVIQWWYENSTINMKINDKATKSAALNQLAAGGPGFGLGVYPDGTTNVWNQKIYTCVFTKNSVPSQANRDNMYVYAKQRTGITETGTGGTGGGGVPTGNFPAKVLGCYYTTWATGTYKVTDVPLDFNVIYLFHIKPNGTPVNGNYNNVGNGSFFFEHYDGVTQAQIQQCRNRGQKVILTAGGASAGFAFDNRTKSTNFVNSLITAGTGIISRLGPLDGLDFNNFEGSILTSGNISAVSTEMVWIAQQLKATYGDDFAITMPPSPNEPLQQQLGQALYNGTYNGKRLLTYAGPQYYDWVGFNAPDYIKGRTDTWVGLLGNNATAVAVGLSANYANGPSLSDCIREYDAIKAAHPNIRGCFCWNAQTNLSGGNVWGSTMRPRL